MTSRKVIPLADRVLLSKSVATDVSKGGIFIPESAKEQPLEGTVLHVGTDVEHITEGDVVIYAKYGAVDINVGGEDLLIVKERDIVAIIK